MVGGPNQRQPAPALTDEDGAFTLTQISAGPFSVMVNKSTYLAGRYPEVGRSMRARGQPLVIAEGQVLDGVTIPLYHGGAIAGRVLDMYGDPIEFAQVRVVRIRGGARPQGMNQTQTNDLGEYRLPRLEPGRYVVHVRPQMARTNFVLLRPRIPHRHCHSPCRSTTRARRRSRRRSQS